MDLCGLHFQGTVSHCEKPRLKQELEAKILEEFCFLVHSLIGSCLADVHTQYRTTCLGMVLPTVGCSLLYQLVIKTIPHRHAHRPMILNFPNFTNL